MPTLGGDYWQDTINKKLNEADIVLFLISSDALASDYFGKEFDIARRRHEQGTARLIPVILRECAWEDDSRFMDKKTAGKSIDKFQVLLYNGEAVTSAKNIDKAYTEIVKGIKFVVVDIQNKQKQIYSKILTQNQQKEQQENAQRIAEELHRKKLQDFSVYYADAQKYYTARDYQQALTAISKALALSPKDTDALSLQVLIKKVIYDERRETAAAWIPVLKKIAYGVLIVAALAAVVGSGKKLIYNTKSYTETVGSVSFKMKYIPAGTLTMGCTSELQDCDDDEKPTHSVTLSAFSMMETEVTQALWREVMDTNPSYNNGCDECPVENVSWDDVYVFIKKLNARTDKTYRLPTEAEWEYAARSGQGFQYAGSNNINEVAWYDENYKNSKHGLQGTTHPVKTKTPNGYGLYDMSGNVWEWCQDWYGNYTKEAQINPKGASKVLERVLRGSGWDDFTESCRISNRFSNYPANRYYSFGFRAILSQ